MSEHTKTPWKAKFTNITQVGIDDSDDIGEFFNGIIECKGYRPLAQANARHIVHCVNNHERLVEALRDLTDEAAYCEHDVEDSEDLRECIAKSRELLAALKPRKGVGCE